VERFSQRFRPSGTRLHGLAASPNHVAVGVAEGAAVLERAGGRPVARVPIEDRLHGLRLEETPTGLMLYALSGEGLYAFGVEVGER